MSQSSISTCKSSSESRKRARTSSPETPTRKSQRKRIILSLPKKYLEISSQSSSESFNKCDTQSTASFSITAGAPSEVPSEKSTSSSQSEYAAIAKKYGISIDSAKQHYSVLTSTAQVLVIRTAFIKQEIVSPEKALQTSPVFGSKKRGRKPKIKIEPKSEEKIDLPREGILSKRASRNIRDYFESFSNEPLSVKQEPLDEFEEQKMPQTCSQLSKNQDFMPNDNQLRLRSRSSSQLSHQMHQQSFSQSPSTSQRFSQSHSYLPLSQTFTRSCSQRSLQSKSSSVRSSNRKLNPLNSRVSKRLSPVKKWKELIDSSGDEFVESRPKKKELNKTAIQEKNETLVSNPFSKIKKQGSQKPKTKSNSFWKKKFGSDDDRVTRKRKFLKTFTLKKEDKSDDVNKNLMDSESKVKVEKEDSEEERKADKTLTSDSMIKKNRIDTENHTTINIKKNSNNIELSTQSSVDSLSVNCQYFNSKALETVTSMSSPSYPYSPVLSFGADPSDYEPDTPVNEKICETNDKPSQDNVNSAVDHEKSDCDNNLEEEENNLNDSFLSLDLMDSPTKSIDVELSVKPLEEQKGSIQETNIETVKKPRAKPKIISDSKLPNNTVILSDPKRIGIRKQLKNSLKAISPDSNEQLSSVTSPLKVSNDTDKQTNGVSTSESEPTFNGMAKNLPLSHDVKQQQQQQQQQQQSKDNVDIEESFDSLCEDITELTNYDGQAETITLYKGNNQDDADAEVLSSSAGNSPSSGQFKTPTCGFLNSDTKEKSSSSLNISTTRKSPITFQRDSRLSLSSPSVTRTRGNTTFNDTKKKSLLGPNTSTTKKSPITFQRSSRLSLLSSKSGFSNVNRARENAISNGTNEKSSPSASSSTSRKSPITFEPNSRHSLSLKSPTIIKTQERITSVKLNDRLQQQNLSPSVNSLNKTEQQQPTSSQFSSPIQTSSTFVNKDPRLNRSISPIKSTNMVSRDPRLNRSISPSKPPALTDPRLVRSNSRPSSPTTSVVPTNESPDPRLRKRAERGDSETTIQLKQEINLVEQENLSPIATRDSQVASQSAQKKTSVFERLGRKSPSPNKNIEVKNELIDIVKSGKVRSIGYYESDDEECISIHPGDMFSSDEESNASPPHRKFTSERMRQIEEIRNKPISIKDRLTLNTNINQRNPPSFATPAVPTTTATTTRTKIINRITFDINVDNQSRLSTVSETTTQPLMQAVPKISGMAAYASQCRKTPFNTYSNNDAAFNAHFYKNNSAALNDKYYKMNTAQMRKDVDNLSQFGSSPTITFDNNTQQTNDTDFMFTADTAKTLFFKRFCFRVLRYGNCSMEMTSCHFSHHVYSLQKLIKEKKIEVLMPILDCAIHQKFTSFLQNVWSSLLPILNDEAFNVYNKLYQAEMRSERFLNELLDYCLNSKLYTVESFVKKLAMFVEKGNRDWVRNICVAIKPKMTDGFCWETIKCLAQKAVPPADMIELTILQCLKRKKNSSHISEVYDLIKNKVTNVERSKMSQTMIKQFFTLVQKACLINDKEALSTIPIASSTNDMTEAAASSPSVSRCQSVESVRSAEVENQGLTVNAPYNVQQPMNSPVDVLKNTPTRGESTNFSEYTVNEVDSSEPTSVFRDRFWKIYLKASVIDKCLDHEDYDEIWNTLNEFCKENVQDTLLKRAYYHILCKNVKSCQRHISEIIKRAVRNRWPSSQKCIDLLFDVGVYALIDLGNSDLWVMALDLLSSLKIIEPNEPKTAFVLICTEIYLANSDPLEALYLLQRTRLIKTNRDEWLTKDHTKDDEKHRNKVVIILLKALSYSEPEKAVYLFKELLTDQYIYYYPIDLRLYLDKLMLLLLLHSEEELVADMCRLIIINDLTLQKATYRELITRMLPVDEVLTNQVLDYAIHLGYYNDIQIKNGFTTVIIDTNSSEEELYLILRRLIYILKLNVGPVVHRLRPNQLKVTLIFEDIPVEKRLYKNEVAAKRSDTYISIRNLVNKMLATRFTPPIRISRGKVSKICKIISRTLVDYLKHWN